MNYIYKETDSTSDFLENNFNIFRKKSRLIASSKGYGSTEIDDFISYAFEELIKQKTIEKYDSQRGALGGYLNWKLSKLFIDFQRNRKEWNLDRWYSFNSTPLSRSYMTIGPRVERLICKNKIPEGEAWKYLSTPQVQLSEKHKIVELTDMHSFRIQMHRFQHKREIDPETGEGKWMEEKVFVNEFEVDGKKEELKWIKNRFSQFVGRISKDYDSKNAILFQTKPPEHWNSDEKDSFPFQEQAGLNRDLNENEINEQLEDIESFIKRAVAELNYSEMDILAFRMVYLLDYKVSEVAGTLHLNRTTLDYRLKKMVQKLREIYGNYGRPKRR